MSQDVEQPNLEKFFRGLQDTFLDGELILGGSSGLFGFATSIPAYTEDLDFYINEELVVNRGSEIIDLMTRLGYRHFPDTPTFAAADQPTFDLVGYSTVQMNDHVSPVGPLQVMVFGDLGIVLAVPGSIHRHGSGKTVLSPAGFVAVKLLTVRVEKGAKDKLQALLVLAERSEEKELSERLSQILLRFNIDVRTDALADAQAALLSLRNDPTFQDRGAERYATFLDRLEMGYRSLAEIIRGLRGG